MLNLIGPFWAEFTFIHIHYPLSQKFGKLSFLSFDSFGVLSFDIFLW